MGSVRDSGQQPPSRRHSALLTRLPRTTGASRNQAAPTPAPPRAPLPRRSAPPQRPASSSTGPTGTTNPKTRAQTQRVGTGWTRTDTGLRAPSTQLFTCLQVSSCYGKRNGLL